MASRIKFSIPRLKIFIFQIIVSLPIVAQEKATEGSALPSISPFIAVNKQKMFKPYFAMEAWATYSMKAQETYSSGEDNTTTEYANRTDISFRRVRFGASGNPYSWLKYCFQLHFDRIGEDSYAATKGSYNGLAIWNAFITAKLLKESDLLNLHAGYFWAAISREYNTSPWAIGSLDKTRSAWYMRKFMTGTGNGIESGIALGGLKNYEKFGVSYRVGTYEPDAYASTQYANRLYTGRLMLSVGDPEQTSYKYMLSGNQWRKRKGITIGVGASTQANGALTDSTFFEQSMAYGADVLINYKGLRIDGEYFMFKRIADGQEDFDGTEWHIRVGYSFIVGRKYLEPVLSYENYEGEGNQSLYKYIGDDNTFDFGINWYLNKDKLKLALHYVLQDGSISSDLGDYIGMACQVKL